MAAGVSGFVQLGRRHLLALIVGALVLVVLGSILFGVCDGGISLLLFAGAAALVGVVVVGMGAAAIAIPMALVVLLLAVVGAYAAAGSRCGL